MHERFRVRLSCAGGVVLLAHGNEQHDDSARRIPRRRDFGDARRDGAFVLRDVCRNYRVEFTLSLPAADGPSDENVYGLTLTFDNGVEQSASLGLIQGLAAGAEGSTRCIAPFGGRKWRRVENRAVMPIPYGVKAFSFQIEGGDEITEPGLDGAAGWYAFRLGGGERAAVSMTDSGDVEWAASLMGRIGALLFIR